MRLTGQREGEVAAERRVEPADGDAVRHAAQNQLRQQADAQPALDHGHDSVIIPRREAHVQRDTALRQCLGHLVVSGLVEQDEWLRAQRLHGAGFPGGERVIRREDRSKIIPLQEDRGELRPRRQTHKATVHLPGSEPVLDLAVVAEQELIVDARIVMRECAQDVWQPVRGHARKRADADMARLQAVQRVHLR